MWDPRSVNELQVWATEEVRLGKEGLGNQKREALRERWGEVKRGKIQFLKINYNLSHKILDPVQDHVKSADHFN